ncbi:exopolysaccharide biosynthesis polyprenyl glycosylphosphotransferase [Nocardioides panacisoli]|uniref:exopolysaccharide biosynthesis polyprenyl glycosylphosphotransferase n=1 Tax=Nocardioides panacisoli TaxID=627624 RepID=UPI001C6337D8|nr:exopolysaccharide biosynthesis polyprenyl glycosylphosphotransferase [Nocardioides panacisoli]QYJ04204.1 exopolysaccharide biosynthesis polyprenyl glycosylphosphotransferase [Nocardioides panacisoli]
MTLAGLGPQLLPGAPAVPRVSMPRPSRRLRTSGVRTRSTERVLADVVAAATGSVVLVWPGWVAAVSATAVVLTVSLVIGWVALVASVGGYRDRLVDACRGETRTVLCAGVRLTVLAAAAAWFLLPTVPRPAVIGAVAMTVAVSTAHRLVVGATDRARQRTGRATSRVLVVGHDTAAQRLVRELSRNARGPVGVVGVCGPDPELIPVQAESLEVDGVIVLPCPHLTPAATRRLAWRLAEDDRHLLLSPGLTGVGVQRASVATLEELPLVHVRHTELTSVRRTVARWCGRVAAASALVLLSPLLLAVAVAIRWDSAGPAVFRQTRVGQHEVPFTMYKFRTMRTDAVQQRDDLADLNENDGVLFKMRQDPRITRLGRFLRRYSLDELPQLLNVARGDMALVGPRPPLPEEVAQYADDVHRRFAVAPGITGLWQVSGRSDLDWDESVRLDLSYVDNWSPLLDLKILLLTVSAVCGHRGAY